MTVSRLTAMLLTMGMLLACAVHALAEADEQKSRLLQKREEICTALGEKTEIGEILSAVMPAWQFEGNEEFYPELLLQSGVFDFGSGEQFRISWTYQESDDGSDEFYQLRITIEYPPDTGNRHIYETQWLYAGDDFESAVRNMKAYQWAKGKSALRVTVELEKT